MKTTPTHNEMLQLIGRPLPFRASYHGTSCIIVDNEGQWATQQVPQDQADKIAISMTDFVTQHRVAQVILDL